MAEVQLVLDSSGRAEVTYQTRWRTSGTMHGFYFEGETAAPDFRGGTAELPNGSRIPLAITAVQPGRWDVVLSGGQAWGPGEATYTFSYRADFGAFGLAEATRAGDGSELVVLNWSPVSWDAPLKHQTLMVTFAPVPAPKSGDLSFEEAAAAVVSLTLEEALAALAEGGIRDAKTILGLYALARRVAR